MKPIGIGLHNNEAEKIDKIAIEINNFTKNLNTERLDKQGIFQLAAKVRKKI